MENSRQIQSDKGRASEGRLSARPAPQNHQAINSKLYSLPISDKRTALLYAPAGYNPKNTAPLALMLHGAGGNAEQGIALLQNFADEFGIVLLAPKSLRATWDVIADGYGADVEFIDQVLNHVFERFSINSSRLAIGGFSDGASYALSLGITNGDLFSHVIAFSPGFVVTNRRTGKPRIYVSHGTRDGVLPIERCSQKFVPPLKQIGYDITYREFEGAHAIPPEINREAVEWFALKSG